MLFAAMNRYLFLLTFMAASFSSYASTVHPAYEGFMQRAVGTSTTVSFASTGHPILVSSRHLGNPHIGAMGLTPGPNGVTLSSTGGIKLSGVNGTVPLIAKTVLSRTLLGRALQIALPMTGLYSMAHLMSDYEYVLNHLRSLNTSSANSMPTLSSQTWPYFPPGLSFQQACEYRARHQAHPALSLISATCIPRFPDQPYREVSIGGGFNAIQTSVLLSFRTSGGSGFDANNIPIDLTLWVCARNPLTQLCPRTSVTDEELLANPNINLSDTAALAAARIAADPFIAPHLVTEKQRLPVHLEFPGGHQSMEILEAEPHVITRTRVLPDGNIETSTQTTQRVARIQPHTQGTSSPTVQLEEQTITKRKVTTPTGQIVTPEETVSTETKPQTQEQPPNCGMPNTPPCRIYEPQSMPRPPMDDAARTLDTIRKDIEQCLSDLPECLGLPDISFSFSMPSACSSLALPGFQRWMQPIDICTYKPYFHSVMGMVWAITGVFGAMAIIGRRF